MREFIKRTNKRFLISTLALIIGSNLIISCTFPGNENRPVAGKGTANDAQQNKSASSEVNRAGGNKPSENEASDTQQTGLVEVYDGRNADTGSPKAPSAADTKLVTDEFKRSEAVIKQKLGDKYCFEPADAEVNVYNSVEGAFTKPNSKQKAFLYAVCELGRGFGVGGILIVENDTVAAHYVGQISWGSVLSTLPDINKNEVSEIVISGGGSGQGYTSNSIELLDFKAGNLNVLGETETYSDNSGAVENDSKARTTAYKISVQPANNPVFFRETYDKKGNAKNFSLTKKSEKFSLSKGEGAGYVKIS